MRSNGGHRKLKADGTVEDDEDFSDVTDDEFEKVLNTDLKGWENRLKDEDYVMASVKQRKAMKKRWKKEGKHDDFDELNDEDPDFGDLYSDQEDSDDNFDDFEGNFYNIELVRPLLYRGVL